MRTLDETLTMIEEIEYSLSISTKGMPPALLTEILSDRLALLAMAPEIMEFASWYHSKGREEVFQEIMASPEIRKEKADNVKLFVTGRLAERDAFYERANQLIRSLEKNIEGVRTIISLEKESLRLDK
jgi:hypothetical protein